MTTTGFLFVVDTSKTVRGLPLNVGVGVVNWDGYPVITVYIIETSASDAHTER